MKRKLEELLGEFISRRVFLRIGGLGGLGAGLGCSAQLGEAEEVSLSGPSRTALSAEANSRRQSRIELMRVALGKKPADLVIENGTLLDTATAELLAGWSVAISGERIAAVGDVKRCIGPETEVLDAKDMFLTPGFVDPHYHCESSRLSPTRHAELTLPMGLTAYFEGTHEITNAALGLPGVEYFIEESRHLPQKIYPAVSSATPPSPVETTSGHIGYEEAMESFQRWGDRVRGIGEVMDLPRVLDGSEFLHGVIQAAIDDHRNVEGHGSPPLDVLDAWTAAGIASSHSPRIGEALTMLRKGVYLQLKTERTADILRQFLELPLRDWSRVGLCVDDRTAADLLGRGSMDNEVREAIAIGVPTPIAYQMATMNNSRHWRVDSDHGILAPGRYADVLLISDLEKVRIEKVVASGELVAEKGRILKKFSTPPIPDYASNRMILKRTLKPEDFRIKAPPGRSQVSAYVLKPRYFSRDLDPITKTLSVKNGVVQRDLERGITKFAIIERYGQGGSIGASFWELGFNRGAIAWTVNHDHHNLAVIGASDEEMAFAANRVVELKGGFVISQGETVLAELALPIAGLMTHEEPESVARKIEALDRVANEFRPVASLAGHTTDRLTFINLTCDPWKYALTDLGLFNLETQERMPVVF